jgi:hypothetical protein
MSLEKPEEAFLADCKILQSRTTGKSARRCPHHSSYGTASHHTYYFEDGTWKSNF